MTDNARKRAARAYQKAHPGTPYLQALREVSNNGRRPLIAQLGRGVRGGDVTVSLECASNGGTGPHCLIVGSHRDDARTMLVHLATRLRLAQQEDDLRLIACTAVPLDQRAYHVALPDTDFTEYVDQLFDERNRMLHSLGCCDIDAARAEGHQIPTAVLLIEERDREWSNSESMTWWARTGRSVGINIVVATPAVVPAPSDPADQPPAGALQQGLASSSIDHALIKHARTAIFSLGGGQATLSTHTPGNKRVVLTDFTFEAA